MMPFVGTVVARLLAGLALPVYMSAIVVCAVTPAWLVSAQTSVYIMSGPSSSLVGSRRVRVGIGFAPLVGAGHGRQERRRHRVDDGAGIDRAAAPRAVAAVTGAVFTGPDLDPVGMRLERAPLCIDDGQAYGRVRRHGQLARAVGFDRRVAKDLRHLELGFADRGAHAGHAGPRRDRPH